MSVTSSAAAPRYAFGDELASSVIHGIGILLSIAGLATLVAYAALVGDARAIVSSAVFGTTLILLYTASTLYHAVPGELAKRVLRTLDHIAIFLLIAGTYTPFTLIALHGVWGWSLFGFTWGLAVIGIGFKIFTTGRFEALSLVVYLLMGWCGVVAARPIVHAMEAGGLWLLLAGGLSYSFGVIFYAWQRLPYHHAIWHGFVLAGSVFHYFSVLFYVIPGPR